VDAEFRSLEVEKAAADRGLERRLLLYVHLLVLAGRVIAMEELHAQVVSQVANRDAWPAPDLGDDARVHEQCVHARRGGFVIDALQQRGVDDDVLAPHGVIVRFEYLLLLRVQDRLPRLLQGLAVLGIPDACDLHDGKSGLEADDRADLAHAQPRNRLPDSRQELAFPVERGIRCCSGDLRRHGS
jgi:hypothetical protein